MARVISPTMSAFDKLLQSAPQAISGYWIGRHLTLRDEYVSKARSTDDSFLRTFFVREARKRSHDLVRALRNMNDAGGKARSFEAGAGTVSRPMIGLNAGSIPALRRPDRPEQQNG